MAVSNSDNSSPVAVGADPTTKRLLVDAQIGFDMGSYDYISASYAGGTSDVYTYKSGGSGGTTVGTITINYTDTTKAVISSVAKT